LLPLIKLLKEHINNSSTGLEELLLGIDKKKSKQKKDDDDSHLKKKRQRNSQEEAVNDEIDPNEIYKIIDSSDLAVPADVTLDDKFQAIAEIIESFKTVFFKDTYNNEFILDALKLNSMDIQKTYEFLCDPNSKKGITSIN
jgi:hypothetical protein